MTEDQIKHMVNRFLSWKLPSNFSPDAGISFKAAFNEHTAHPMKHEPSGTNLFDFTQTDAMVRYMLEGLPCPQETASE
jgi:outer membrane receptor for ferrienterochelin and colicin